MTVSVRPLTREEVAARFDDMARLRIAVFRAFPYLYDGDMDYERRYLETYAAAPGAFVCGALDGDDLVGMATASPLSQHKAEFAAPFAAHRFALRTSGRQNSRAPPNTWLSP